VARSACYGHLDILRFSNILKLRVNPIIIICFRLIDSPIKSPEIPEKSLVCRLEPVPESQQAVYQTLVQPDASIDSIRLEVSTRMIIVMSKLIPERIDGRDLSVGSVIYGVMFNIKN